MNPHLVQFPADLLASSAAATLPAAKSELTFAAFTIPTMPNGRQQKIVTKMDSAIHVFGQTPVAFSSIISIF